jgi:cell division septum initiation protein DivIVA
MVKNAELDGRIKEYEVELKRSADNSTKIGKQIKQVETELKGIKKQANTESTEKTKLMEDYEEMIASLQQKMLLR